MEKTTQTPPADPAFDEIKGKIPMDPEDEQPKEEPEPVKEPEAPKEEPAPQPAKEEAPKQEEQPKEGRPETYIPIAQYTSEKKGWRETEEGYKKRISELEAITASKEGAPSSEAKVKAYAEKYGVTEEAVRDLVGLMAADKEKEASPSSFTPEQQAQLEEARQIKAQKAFDDEFTTSAVPELKKHFPNATPEQLAAAKEEIAKLACTKPFLDKSLDFVIYKSQEALAAHFKEDRKGPEGQRGAINGAPHYAPSDFKDGKTSFSELASLSIEERDRVVKGFDPKTWDDYTHFVRQNDEIRMG